MANGTAMGTIIVLMGIGGFKPWPKRGCEQCLENFISEDVMSRLAENGVLLRFTGDDWRKTKRQKEAQK